MNYMEYMVAMTKQVDKALEKYLPAEASYPETIHRAMRYSVFAGGKRLRPILVLAAAKAVGGKEEEVLPAACAIEMIHTYSLIHDDLPALDNDDLRRGKATNHKVFGEAMAILAGDALLTLAFELLTMGEQEPSLKMAAIREVAMGAGTLGMIGGQVVDLESESRPIDKKTLEFIHTRKTGVLFRVSLRVGAILGGGKEEEIEALTSYGENLGLAFQIVDDILDAMGEEEKLGKPVGSDVKNFKATYLSQYGLEDAWVAAEMRVEKAIGALKDFGEEAWFLRELANYVLKRDR